MESIYNLVKEAEKNYTHGTVKRGKYLDNWDMYDTIEKINAYANSQHISGKFDALGREKPFFNIVVATMNVWYRATDIDRKNIKFRATNSKNYTKSFVASILLRDWMRKERFGQFLNKWGRTLSKYGSAIVKFVEKDGELNPSVVAWDKFICDPVEFAGNLKIEKLYYTPSQLRKIEAYNQEEIEKAIESLEDRKTLDGQQKDNRSEYIGVYEVHGELPLSLLTNRETDKKTYRQQMYVIFINNGTSNKNYADKFETTLYSGKEAKDPYMITHLIEEEGRTLGIGPIEYLFDPQWMVNHSAKQIKDQLDLASKMILQTSDEYFAGRNVLTNLETGDILVHSLNQPLTQVNNQSHDTPAITSYLQQWQALARDITGTPEAITGDTMPAGTAYRQVVALQQEAHSLFELMLENKGLYLEDMLREFVIPFFKKKLDTAKEVALILEPEELQQLDQLSLPDNLEEEIKRLILTENAPLPSIEELTAGVQEKNAKFGATRFLKPSKKKITWKEYFKDLEDDIEVKITGENVNKEVVLTTLNTIMQTIAQNPTVLQDPIAKKIFGKILEMTGEISPIELQQTQTPMPQQAVQAQMGGGQGMPQIAERSGQEQLTV